MSIFELDDIILLVVVVVTDILVKCNQVYVASVYILNQPRKSFCSATVKEQELLFFS